MSEAVLYADVPEFPGYRVGSDGSVWSRLGMGPQAEAKEWRKLRPQPVNPHGYFKIPLRRDGRTLNRWVHRLVLEAFVGPCPPGHVARHFPDQDPANNSLDNLSWGSRSQNMLDRRENGTDNRGSRHPLAKLDERSVRRIRHLARAVTSTVLAPMFGVTPRTIRRIVQRKSWQHVP